MATTIAALNSNKNRSVSAAAGREAQFTNMNFGSNKRNAYGYAAESLPLVETVASNIRQTIIADDELSQTGSSSRLVSHGMRCANRTVDEMKILVQNNWDAAISNYCHGLCVMGIRMAAQKNFIPL